MTWIYDGSGKHWVDTPQKKRRKSPRAIRFGEIKVGDQLMRVYTSKGWRGGKDDMNAPPVNLSQATGYYIVTDLWFDPVAGQKNPEAGNMVAISQLDMRTGQPVKYKEPHTRRGLASQGFHYADRDFQAFCADRLSAMESGAVVGIGVGRVLKRRPKQPGRNI